MVSFTDVIKSLIYSDDFYAGVAAREKGGMSPFERAAMSKEWNEGYQTMDGYLDWLYENEPEQESI